MQDKPFLETVYFSFNRFYDLEKWEAKQREKGRMKELKKAQKQKVSIESDELRHKSLHSGPARPGKEMMELERRSSTESDFSLPRGK